MRKVFIFFISILTIFLFVGCVEKEDPFEKAYNELTIEGDLNLSLIHISEPTRPY